MTVLVSAVITYLLLSANKKSKLAQKHLAAESSPEGQCADYTPANGKEVQTGPINMAIHYSANDGNEYFIDCKATLKAPKVQFDEIKELAKERLELNLRQLSLEDSTDDQKEITQQTINSLENSFWEKEQNIDKFQ
jgi:hypothetical protein